MEDLDSLIVLSHFKVLGIKQTTTHIRPGQCIRWQLNCTQEITKQIISGGIPVLGSAREGQVYMKNAPSQTPPP